MKHTCFAIRQSLLFCNATWISTLETCMIVMWWSYDYSSHSSNCGIRIFKAIGVVSMRMLVIAYIDATTHISHYDI